MKPKRRPVPKRVARQRAGRFRAAGALVAIYVVACLVYGFQAWDHDVPWLFQDEIYYASQAREYAATGDATIRGGPSSDEVLTARITSLAWHFDDPETDYLAAKLLNVLLMTAACFPAYALARIVVGRPAALFAAAGTVAIPAFVYASMIVTEPLAYPLATTAFWLMTRTLASERITAGAVAWAAATVGTIWVAGQARSQLQILFVAFAVAGALRLLLSQPVRSRLWLVIPGSLALGAVLYLGYERRLRVDAYLKAVEEGNWDILARQATWSFGALAIGLAVVPIVLGVAALLPTGKRRHSGAHIAFSLVASVGIASLVYYTAVKGTFLWLTFAWRVIERNLIYAAPLLFVAVAIFLQYRRLNPLALAGALATVAYAVYKVPYQLDFRIYADAPGLAILSTANRHLQWTDDSVRKYLAVMLTVSALIALAAYLLRSRRIVRVGAACLGVGLVAAALAAEVAADRSSRGAGRLLAANLPKPYDWVWEATDGARSILIGTAIADPNGIWLTQFFNPNLWYLASLDSSAPAPGPNSTLHVVSAKGHLEPDFPDARFAVVDNKAEIVGRVLRRTRFQTLYEIDQPLRLTHGSYGVTGDGWMSERAIYYQFAAPRRGPGVLRVRASRAAWGGPDAPGEVTIRVFRLRGFNGDVPVRGATLASERLTIHTRQIVDYYIPVPGPPFAVEITVDPVFSPADYGVGDTRLLGIQPEFEYMTGYRLPRLVKRVVSPGEPGKR